MSVVLIAKASPALAAGQASWIADMEPWRGLGYRAPALRSYLRRTAGAGDVFVARQRVGGSVLGVVVVQPGVLLGNFVSLLAVRPSAAGQGLGRSLMAYVESRTFETRRWLFVSADVTNATALKFYRRQGFRRVGKLPDLVQPGRTEILLRKGRPAS